MRGLPRRFWLYAAVVLLYGIVETLNGNWSTLYLTQQRGVPTQWASLALTAFWAMVTVGRVLAAVASSRVPTRWIYLGLPVLLVVAFLVVSQVSTAIGGVLAFGLAGLACSAFFPLSISFGGRRIYPLNRGRLRRIDRLLPGRLWHRRVWSRTTPGLNWCSLVDHLRGSQSRGWCDDRACLPGDQAADHEICSNERMNNERSYVYAINDSVGKFQIPARLERECHSYLSLGNQFPNRVINRHLRMDGIVRYLQLLLKL